MVNKCSEMSDSDKFNIVILRKDHIMIGYSYVMSTYYLNFLHFIQKCFRVREILA